MLDRFVLGAVIVVSMVLGGALVVGVNALDSDDTPAATVAALPTATPAGDTNETPTETAGTISQTINGQVADLYEQVRPSVVRINARDSGSNSGGVGSGIVLDKEGHILTNNHVVGNFDSIDVILADGTAASATVLGRDPGNDLAVLQTDLPADLLVPATFGDSDALRPGEFVIAVGNPFDLEGSVTEGIVSGLSRTLEGGSGRPLRQLIQADAAINPGNSGGGLFNANGQLIGITTAIENPSNDRVFVGVGYAVPSNVVTRFLPNMLNGETIEHPRLGVALENVTPAIASDLSLSVEQGVLILAVEPGTGADSAGLRGGVDSFGQATGDVIVRIDGQAIRDYDDLANYIDGRKVGDVVEVTVVRDGAEVQVPVTLNAWQAA
jgi:S1-C subfamily serine protease